MPWHRHDRLDKPKHGKAIIFPHNTKINYNNDHS